MQVVGRRSSHTSRKEPTQSVKKWKFQWRIIPLLLLDVREIVVVVVVGGNKTFLNLVLLSNKKLINNQVSNSVFSFSFKLVILIIIIIIIEIIIRCEIFDYV
jgi:hypothetical protein